jgi:hypothetical protein
VQPVGNVPLKHQPIEGLNVNSFRSTCGNFHLKFKQLYFSTKKVTIIIFLLAIRKGNKNGENYYRLNRVFLSAQIGSVKTQSTTSVIPKKG